MLITGTTHLKSKVGTGIFSCPQCEAEAPFTKKKATEYFTLYFIPIFPIGARGHVIECDVCRGSFTEDILDYDPDAERIANQAAVFRILVSFMVYFSKSTDKHVAACKSAYWRLLDQEVPEEVIQKELQLAMQPGSDPSKFIQVEGATFAPEAKIQILVSAKEIIRCEPVDEEHVKIVLKQFTELMGMPTNDFESIYQLINELSNSY